MISELFVKKIRPMKVCGVVKKCGGLRKKILANFAYY